MKRSRTGSTPSLARVTERWLLPKARWLVLGLVALAWGIQLYRLGVPPLHGDEYSSIREASDLGLNPHAWLWYSFMRLWLRGSDGELWLRFPSAIWATMTVPLIYQLGRRVLGDGAAATIAAALSATSPFVVTYGQQLRFYTLFLLAATLSYYTFWRWWTRRRAADLWLWLLTIPIVVGSHLLGWLVLGVELLVWVLYEVWERRRWRGLGWSLGVLVIITATSVPLIQQGYAFLNRITGGSGSYTGPRGLGIGQLAKLPLTGFFFLFGEHVYPLWWWPVIPGLVVAGTALIVGLYTLRHQPRALTLLLVGVTVPAFALFLLLDALTTTQGQHVAPRHVMFLLPLFWLLIAQGLKKIPCQMPLLIVLLAVNASSLQVYYAQDWSYDAGEFADWRAAAQLVQRYANGNTVLLTDGRSSEPATRYFPPGLPRRDLWEFADGDMSSLSGYDRIVVTTFDVFPERQARFNRALMALHHQYRQTDAWVQYPLFVYVYERQLPGESRYTVDPATGLLDIPESLYGLEFQDLQLPVSIEWEGEQLKMRDAFQLPDLDGQRRLTLPLGSWHPVGQVVLFSNVTAASALDDGTEVAALTVYDAEGHSYRYPLRLGRKTASWDGACVAPCRPVLTWTKRIAFVGSMYYEGAYRHFSARIFAAPLNLPAPGLIDRIEIEYTATTGVLNVWGLCVQ